MTPSCKNCAFWAIYPLKGSGECRRHAPAPMYSLTGDKPGPIWWPQTLASFWCGDYFERPHLFFPPDAESEKFPKKIRKKSTKKVQKENEM